MLLLDIQKKSGTFQLDVSLKIEKGILGIKGPSGAGKSTLLDCLAGISPIDSGEIIHFGKRWNQGNKIFTTPQKRDIGYVFQGSALFPNMTVGENLLFGHKSDAVFSPEELIDKLELQEYLDQTPNTLSGGQGQRVALARSILSNPELLLLDEATSALDRKTKTAVVEVLKELDKRKQGKIIVVSHDDNFLNSLAHRVVEIEEGELVK